MATSRPPMMLPTDAPVSRSLGSTLRDALMTNRVSVDTAYPIPSVSIRVDWPVRSRRTR